MKPILFNTEMVKAILDGRKTVTRRVIKPQPTYSPRDGFTWNGYAYGTDFPPTLRGAGYNLSCAAPFKVNDILYVRETWCSAYDGGEYFYLADKVTAREKYWLLDYDNVKWRPSIHMPKKVARIFLRVTGVHVERLQDITEEQAKAEGVNGPYSYAENDDYWETTGRNELSADVAAFSALWDSTVHKSNIDRYGWDANPYVWVIEFEVIDKAVALANDTEGKGK